MSTADIQQGLLGVTRSIYDKMIYIEFHSTKPGCYFRRDVNFSICIEEKINERKIVPSSMRKVPLLRAFLIVHLGYIIFVTCFVRLLARRAGGDGA